MRQTGWGAFRSLSVGGVGVTHPHLNFKTTQPGEDTQISRRFIPRRPVTSLSCADIRSLQVVMKYPVSVSFRINIYTLLCFLCTLRYFLFALRCFLFTYALFCASPQPTMKLLALATLAATLMTGVSAHTRAWSIQVNGKDKGAGAGRYIRQPPSNDPVKDLTSSNMRCNVNGNNAVPNYVTVPAGSTITTQWCTKISLPDD